jgi:hypothetical protein
LNNDSVAWSLHGPDRMLRASTRQIALVQAVGCIPSKKT